MDRLTDNTNYCTVWTDCEMREADCEFHENCYERKMYEKLKAYEDAEEQGLLILLPFNVDDEVWQILRHCEIRYCEEEEKECDKCRHLIKFAWPNRYETKRDIMDVMHEFGKSIFLTREEAEKALAEMEK